MHTIEDSESIIRMNAMSIEDKQPKTHNPNYVVIPIYDPKHEFATFDIISIEKYRQALAFKQDLEKMEEKGIGPGNINYDATQRATLKILKRSGI